MIISLAKILCPKCIFKGRFLLFFGKSERWKVTGFRQKVAGFGSKTYKFNRKQVFEVVPERDGEIGIFRGDGVPLFARLCRVDGGGSAARCAAEWWR